MQWLGNTESPSSNFTVPNTPNRSSVCLLETPGEEDCTPFPWHPAWVQDSVPGDAGSGGNGQAPGRAWRCTRVTLLYVHFLAMEKGHWTASPGSQKGSGEGWRGRPPPPRQGRPGPGSSPQSPAHPAPGWSRCRSDTAAGPAPPSRPRWLQELGERREESGQGKGGGGAGAESATREPRAGLSRQRGRPGAGPLPSRASGFPRSTHTHADELFTWLASRLNSPPVSRGESTATATTGQRP
jgi:hypothetical protein